MTSRCRLALPQWPQPPRASVPRNSAQRALRARAERCARAWSPDRAALPDPKTAPAPFQFGLVRSERLALEVSPHEALRLAGRYKISPSTKQRGLAEPADPPPNTHKRFLQHISSISSVTPCAPTSRPTYCRNDGSMACTTCSNAAKSPAWARTIRRGSWVGLTAAPFQPYRPADASKGSVGRSLFGVRAPASSQKHSLSRCAHLRHHRCAAMGLETRALDVHHLFARALQPKLQNAV